MNGKYGNLVPVSNSIKLYKSMKNALKTNHNKSILTKRALDFNIDKISDEYLFYLGLKKI